MLVGDPRGDIEHLCFAIKVVEHSIRNNEKWDEEQWAIQNQEQNGEAVLEDVRGPAVSARVLVIIDEKTHWSMYVYVYAYTHVSKCIAMCEK